VQAVRHGSKGRAGPPGHKAHGKPCSAQAWHNAVHTEEAAGHRNLRMGPQARHKEEAAGGSSDCKAGGKEALVPCMRTGRCELVQVLGILHRDRLSWGNDPLQHTAPSAAAGRRTEAAAGRAALVLALDTGSEFSLEILVVAVVRVRCGRSEKNQKQSSLLAAAVATEVGHPAAGC